MKTARVLILSIALALGCFTLCDAQTNFLTLATIFSGAGQLITSNASGTPVRVVAGTSGQALVVGPNLVPVFSSQSQVSSTDSIIQKFGRDDGTGAFQDLAEIKTRQQLTGTSGTEIGRGALKLYDTIAAPNCSMELGFYSAGAGLFTDCPVYEMWAQDVSVRPLSGVSNPILEVRDATDVKNIALRHISNQGAIYTSGYTDGTATGGIAMTPGGNNTYTFVARDAGNNKAGDLQQSSLYGGHIVQTRANTAVAQPPGDALTAAGTTIADALQLTKVWNNISTVAASTGVKLWNPIATDLTTEVSGVQICTRNGGASDLILYPPTSSDQINAGTAGHGVTLTTANKQIGCCYKTAALKWWCTVQNSATVL